MKTFITAYFVGFFLTLIVGLFLALALCRGANASEPVTVGIHLISAHTAPVQNNANVGAYLRYRGWVAGGYRTTEDGVAGYAGYVWEPTSYVAVTLGVVTGYRASTLGPLFAVTVFGPRVYGVRPALHFVPPVGENPGLVNLGFEF